MFFRKKINTLDMETQVNTITAQQARKLTEESISKVRQKAVSDELNKIYSRVRESINDGFGHNFFSFHITPLERESEESRKKIKEKLDEGVSSKDVLDSLTQGFTENGFEDFKNKLMGVFSSISNEGDMRSKYRNNLYK